MRVLITGITGMVGSHMADYLCADQPAVEVHGTKRWRSPMDNIRHLGNAVTLHDADLRDLNSLVSIMKTVRPDRIFHLAAQSYVMTSFTAPADTLHTNAIGTVNLLDAIRIADLDPLIHICSSSEVYGQVRKEEMPITETVALRPASPYAVSKVAEDMLGLQYFLSYGLKTFRTRMFTHTGPRRGSVFAESSFAEQIAQIEAGIQPGPVKVGNLDSVRTISDVRDAVRAYWLLLEKGAPGDVYNIGGSEVMTIRDVLETLIDLSTSEIHYETDPARLRPSDVTLQVPDVTKFIAATGWTATIPARQTLNDLLNHHRDGIRLA